METSIMRKLTGEVALVTGAGRSQGRSHAIQLAEEGAAVIALDICAPVEGISYALSTPADLAATKRLIEATGARAITVQVDTRDPQKLTRLLDQSITTMGGLDICVANAGVFAMHKFDEFTQAEWDAIVGVNLTGTWNTMRAVAPHLIARGGGTIIVIASVAGLVGSPFMAPYVASKHGIVGLMRTLALELASSKVRVNAICPTGVADTPMLGTLDQNLLNQAGPRLQAAFENALLVDAIPISAVSDAVLFLAGDEAQFITGDTLKVDAGLTTL
jgi:SDR family mycofactocin-dependent oxidoreductase